MAAENDLRATAPYRFIPLNGEVVETQHSDQLETLHNVPLQGGLSASLTVEWAAETPFLIGEEREAASNNAPALMGPMELGEDYAIPGASIRGMLRSVMEVSCFARLRQINEHHRYGLRDFQHDHYRSSLLDQNSVHAGWMRRQGDGWVLWPCDWKPVTIESLLTYSRGMNTERWLTSNRFRKFDHLGAATRVGKDRFTVDWDKLLFPVKMGDKGRMAVGGNGDKRFIVPSGAAVNTSGKFAKKVEYAFTEGDPAQEVPIHHEAWRVFEAVHCKPSRNKSEPDGAWAEWIGQAEAGDWIPVFYIGTPGASDQAIGLTRLFRLPSRNSVGEVRDKAIRHKRTLGEKLDMVEGLFGFVDEDFDRGPNSKASALRGRIRCGFARLQNKEDARETDPMDVVMMGPRASFAPFYLIRDQDWSGDPLLAGRKRYPVRFAQDRGKALDDIRARFQRSTLDAQGEPVSDGSQSRLVYLHGDGKDLVFRGEIRLHNITVEELGAVLWALRLGEGDTKNRRHALGRGKAFGCGQMRVKSIGLRVFPNQQDNDDLNAMLVKRTVWDRGAKAEHWMPPRATDAEEWHAMTGFLQAYTKFMGSKVTDWSKSSQIQALLASTNPARGEKLRHEDKLNYLGEVGSDRKEQDGHTAHMGLKRNAKDLGKQVNLPWS